ncbi:hypothetical protein LEMLEM_LOCUS17437, partial [Lemmus lemmus]
FPKAYAATSLKGCALQNTGSLKQASLINTRRRSNFINNRIGEKVSKLVQLSYEEQIIAGSAIIRSFLLQQLGTNTETHNRTIWKVRNLINSALNRISLSNPSRQSSGNLVEDEAEGA